MVTCPACRRPFQVEETLEIVPDSALDRASASRQVPPGTCPTCGFPLLPGVAACNRCGTDMHTGGIDPGRVGYHASATKEWAGRVVGWILTLAIIVGVGYGIYYVVRRVRAGYGRLENKYDGGDEGRGAKDDGRGPAKPPVPGRPGTGGQPTHPAGAPAAGTAAGQPLPPPPAKPGISERFDAAYTLLADPLPETQAQGAGELARLGAAAVPFVIEKLASAQDVGVRAALVRVLGRTKAAEIPPVLVERLSDPDDRVRDAAIEGLRSQGRPALDAVVNALAGGTARAKAAAILVLADLGARERASDVIRCLRDQDAAVRFEAARALGGPIGGPDAARALVDSLGDINIDVAAAASEALVACDESIEAVTAAVETGASGGAERKATTLFFLAKPVLHSRNREAQRKLAEAASADLASSRMEKFAQDVLTAPEAATRAGALRSARGRITMHPAPLIASLAMNDPDGRVRQAAFGYLVSLPKIEFLLPLVVELGSKDVDGALATADALAAQAEVGPLLRRVVKGVHPQRAVLAAGVLARKTDPAGRDVLVKAYSGQTPLGEPLPGWAAYQLSFLGSHSQASGSEFMKLAEDARSRLNRTYFYAAAARLGMNSAADKLLGTFEDRHLPVEVRAEVIKVLGDLKARGVKEKLLAALEETHPSIQIAAATALARLGDSDVVPRLISRLPNASPQTTEAMRDVILSFGVLSEGYLANALESADMDRMQIALIEIIEGLGDRATARSPKALIGFLRGARASRPAREAAVAALQALKGVEGEPSWTWRQWARACGVELEDIATDLVLVPQEWGWLAIDTPHAWQRHVVSVVGEDAPGRPSIDVTTARDPEDRDKQAPPGMRRYGSSDVLRNVRIAELAMATASGRVSMREGVKVAKGATFKAGGCSVAPARIIDQEAKRATYWLFMVIPGKRCNWYGEVALSSTVDEYETYRDLFENTIPKTLRILKERLN